MVARVHAEAVFVTTIIFDSVRLTLNKHYCRGKSLLLSSMMTSSNGNIFRFIGPWWGKSTGLQWIPSQRPVTWALMFSSICVWTNSLANNRDAGISHSLSHHCNAVICTPIAIVSAVRIIIQFFPAVGEDACNLAFDPTPLLIETLWRPQWKGKYLYLFMCVCLYTRPHIRHTWCRTEELTWIPFFDVMILLWGQVWFSVDFNHK